MFTMMNHRAPRGRPAGRRHRRARDAAGAAYARERKQGRAPARHPARAPIIEHPDVRRMLLTMRALTARRARDLLRHRRPRSTARIAARTTRRARPRDERASLLTPVAKAFSTDIGIEVASLGVQVHGGMGFIEETGAAQHLSRRAHRRDLRRHQRHPGDRSRRRASCRCAAARWCAAYLDELRAHGRRRCRPRTIRRSARPARGLPKRSTASTARPRGCSASSRRSPTAALAGATPYLRLFGNAAGGCMLADEALAALRIADGEPASRVAHRALLRGEHRRAGARAGDAPSPKAPTASTRADAALRRA